MFSGVEWMALRSQYDDGLASRQVGLEQLPDLRGMQGRFSRWAKVFLLTKGATDLVVAGAVQWHEDDGAFDEPSFLGD